MWLMEWLQPGTGGPAVDDVLGVPAETDNHSLDLPSASAPEHQKLPQTPMPGFGNLGRESVKTKSSGGRPSSSPLRGHKDARSAPSFQDTTKRHPQAPDIASLSTGPPDGVHTFMHAAE